MNVSLSKTDQSDPIYTLRFHPGHDKAFESRSRQEIRDWLKKTGYNIVPMFVGASDNQSLLAEKPKSNVSMEDVNRYVGALTSAIEEDGIVLTLAEDEHLWKEVGKIVEKLFGYPDYRSHN